MTLGHSSSLRDWFRIQTLTTRLPGLASILPRLSRITILVLTPALVGLSLFFSGVAFFYPLEIETRESTIWLHVLAMKEGINIYDHSRVAFINISHGPLDALFKFAVASLLPFLESWQVTRFAVFLLPYLYLAIAWVLLRKRQIGAPLHWLYLGSIGYLFLVVTAKDVIFVGRPDATATFFLLLLLTALVAFSPGTYLGAAGHGLVCGVAGVAVILANWRVAPTIIVVFVLAAFIYWRVQRAGIGVVLCFLTSSTLTALLVCGVLLYCFFSFDVLRYSKLFFGFFLSDGPKWAADGYEGSTLSYIASLFNPVALNNKGGPVLLGLAVVLLVPGKRKLINKAWLSGVAAAFVFCAVAFYFKFYGGGSYYFIPFLVVLWFLCCTNASQMREWRLALLGLCVVLMLMVTVRTSVFPTLKRALRINQAREFITNVRRLEQGNTILSEDTFLFRTSYHGELIDMGDMISAISPTGYYGEEFSKTATRHFDQTRLHPPDYIVAGFTESPELMELIKNEYVLIAEGPYNLTANHNECSKLFKRKDLVAP